MRSSTFATVCLLLLPACGGASGMADATAALMARPEHDAASIEVQHVLIAFAGSGTSQSRRTQQAAEALADKVFQEAVGGADFGELVNTYTDDSPPGIYAMTAAADASAGPPGATPRGQMVAGFGDVGWRLRVGEIGVALHDAQKSPYGWHIIKRLK